VAAAENAPQTDMGSVFVIPIQQQDNIDTERREGLSTIATPLVTVHIRMPALWA